MKKKEARTKIEGKKFSVSKNCQKNSESDK